MRRRWLPLWHLHLLHVMLREAHVIIKRRLLIRRIPASHDHGWTIHVHLIWSRWRWGRRWRQLLLSVIMHHHHWWLIARPTIPRSYHPPTSWRGRRRQSWSSPSSSIIIPLPAIIPRNSVVIRMRPYHLPSSSARRSHHCNSCLILVRVCEAVFKSSRFEIAGPEIGGVTLIVLAL